MILFFIMATCNTISIFILETVVEFKKKKNSYMKKETKFDLYHLWKILDYYFDTIL